MFVEHERGATHPVSWELLGEGRKLADQLGVELAAVVLGAPGPAIRRACEKRFCYGADVCYLIEDPVLRDYRNEPYTKGLDRSRRQIPAGDRAARRDHARAAISPAASRPRLATGLTADCTELNIDLENRSLAATRPTFGGSLLCTIQTLNYRPQMATVRPRVMRCPSAAARAAGRIIEETLGMVESASSPRCWNTYPTSSQDKAQLAYADIIVSGGRGLKRPENFQLVWDLAEVLGAEVGATRPLIQAGWVTADRQVGQTGKTVRPKLYIAAGISGAIQHRVGMESSDVIIAINEDPNAPIFDFATYGIVGNAMQILPALTDAFRQHLATVQARGLTSAWRASRGRIMSEQFDVIVVGAGPSGNAAAYTAAKAGLKVLQIERGESPGSKNVQGAILYSDALEKIIPDFRDDAPLERHLIEQRMWMLDDDSYVGSTYRSEAFNTPPYNRYTIIRAQFDKWFSKKVQDAGRAGHLRDDGARAAHGRRSRGRRRHRPRRRLGLRRRRDSCRRRQFIAGQEGRLSSANCEPRDVALAVKEIHFLPDTTIESRFNVGPEEGVAIEMAGKITQGMVGTGFLYTNTESLTIGVGCLLSDLRAQKITPACA